MKLKFGGKTDEMIFDACKLLLLQPFYGSLDLSGTTQVSQYQKGKTKTNLDFLQQETVGGSGIS